MVKPARTLHLPGETMTFQRIPAEGKPKSFRMGERGLGESPFGFTDPVIKVCLDQPCLDQPFYLGTLPVTQKQFMVWTKAEGIDHENEFRGHPDHPAESMTRRQAVAYCGWLTQVAARDMPKGYIACLPTEAEWEYACRADTDTEYHTGDGEAALGEARWFADNSQGSTQPVGRKQPNAFGLFDMHGNVWEWCHDAWEEAPYRSRVDGDGDAWCEQRLKDWQAGLQQLTKSDRFRVLRGGSWGDSAGDCRSACRFRHGPGHAFRDFGFRVCLVPGPGRQTTETDSEIQAEPAPGDGGRGTRPESDGAGEAAAGPDLAHASLPRAARAYV